MKKQSIDDYIASRIEEALKEKIMNNEFLRENRLLREVYHNGFMDGVSTISKIINDLERNIDAKGNLGK